MSDRPTDAERAAFKQREWERIADLHPGVTPPAAPRTPHPDSFEYRVAILIARQRFGPGLDMGGAHNPTPAEWRLARQIAIEAAAPAASDTHDEARAMFGMPPDHSLWHGDGDQCIGIHCINPEHGWAEAAAPAAPEDSTDGRS